LFITIRFFAKEAQNDSFYAQNDNVCVILRNEGSGFCYTKILRKRGSE